MASWSKDRVEPNAINGGREFTRDDNLALNELNAIVNNSFYASETSDKAFEFVQTAENTLQQATEIVGSAQNTLDRANEISTELEEKVANDYYRGKAGATFHYDENTKTLTINTLE